MADVTDRIARLSQSQLALLELRLAQLGLDDLVPGAPGPGGVDATPVSRGANERAVGVEGDFPLLVHAPRAGMHLADWIAENAGWLKRTLQASGAIVFRRFLVEGAAGLQQCIERAWGEPADYPGFAQSVVLRTRVRGKIYTSAEYSPAFRIPLHNECAFASSWPARICFLCVTPAAAGGQTPIADSRRVLGRITRDTLDRLERLGIMYVRNFGYGSARSWEKAFGTDDRSRVEEICAADGVTCEWTGRARLRTRSIRPAVALHPVTGETVWFNHINSAHIASLEPELRDALLAEFDRDDLPRNCYYGDGSQIEPGVIDEIRQACDAETVVFDWQAGDVLMLDNMLTAHGRLPFEGAREVLVGMSGSIERDDLRPPAR